MSSNFILALDFGGTKLSAALVSSEDTTKWIDSRQTKSSPNATRGLDKMIQLAHELLGECKPAAIGVSFGGLVDVETGQVIRSFQVRGWENYPLVNKLQEVFSTPVIFDNDANVAGLGEWRFGAGQGFNSLFYITVSTGVGGGWILNGSIYRGANGLAGEIGHIVIKPGGPLCGCGKRGCVESLASGLSIARLAQERLAVEPQAGSRLRKICKTNPTAITAKHVSRAAEDGDELSIAVLDEASRALGQGIGLAITLMNPQRVILGGGVSKSGTQYWQTLRETASTFVLPSMTVDIVPALLGDNAPLWGAVAMAEELLR